MTTTNRPRRKSGQVAKPEPRKNRLKTTLPAPIAAEFRKAAKERGMSMSALLREIVHDDIKRHEHLLALNAVPTIN